MKQVRPSARRLREIWRLLTRDGFTPSSRFLRYRLYTIYYLIYILLSINKAYIYKVPSTAIGSVPSLSGDDAITHRWRLPPRVHRHKAGSLEGITLIARGTGAAFADCQRGPIFVRLSSSILYGHTHITRVRINRVRLPILLVVS